MAKCEIRIVVRVAWWFRPYLWALGFFCQLHGREPDLTKLQSVFRRAVRVEAETPWA